MLFPSPRQEGPGPWLPSFERPCLGAPAGLLPTGEESMGPEDAPSWSPWSSPLPDHILGNWDLIPETVQALPQLRSPVWAILTVCVWLRPRMAAQGT